MNTPIASLPVRPSFRKKLLFLGGGISALLCISSAGAQDVAYRETFYSPFASSLSSSNPALGWHFDRAPSVGGVVVNADNLSTRSNINGQPTDLPAINAGTYAGTDVGLIFNDAPQGLFYTNEYTDLLSQNVSQVSWYAANSNAASTQRVAVQVDGNWFVSTEKFGTAALTGAAFDSGTAEHEILTFAGSTWNTLGYSVGSTAFSIGSSEVSLSAGNVTSFGLFVASTSGNIRFDTYEITTAAIPEPSTSAAILGFAALGVLIWRRQIKTVSSRTE